MSTSRFPFQYNPVRLVYQAQASNQASLQDNKALAADNKIAPTKITISAAESLFRITQIC